METAGLQELKSWWNNHCILRLHFIAVKICSATVNAGRHNLCIDYIW